MFVRRVVCLMGYIADEDGTAIDVSAESSWTGMKVQFILFVDLDNDGDQILWLQPSP